MTDRQYKSVLLSILKYTKKAKNKKEVEKFLKDLINDLSKKEIAARPSKVNR